MSLSGSIRDATPWPLRLLSRQIKREIRWVLDARRPVKDVFQRTYRDRRWADSTAPFHSGPGSVGRTAELYADVISEFILDHDIRSVVDLGCGDFQVASRIVGDHFDYVGVDVVDELVELNCSRFGSPHVHFASLDITKDALPDGELCLLREVLQHLSNHEIAQVLRAVAKYPYVIYSDYQPGNATRFVPNRDIPHGHDTRLWRNSAVCLDQPPFNIPLQQLLEVPSSTTLRGPGECIRTFLLLSPTASQKPHNREAALA